ncbi:MAG: gamma-glutamyl-phosphate reductase, partial [Oscillospiraceae bacterium]|nr:gamma-glutamyl-phosphate reductase [Oscillospiraceae bacterium]
MEYIEELGKKAKAAAPFLAGCDDTTKCCAMGEVARRLNENPAGLIEANRLDIENGRKNGMSEALIDRLTLNEKRIAGMTEGVMQVCGLPDPIGEIISQKTLPNGLVVTQKRVPMGVIGIIYESRPNVTLDAAALCFKAGSAVILRGGSDAFNSNKYLVDLMRRTIADFNIPADCIQLVEDTSRDTANAMMKADKYL